MTLSASTPNEKVAFDLEFYKPMKGKNLVEFTFVPEGQGTKVTWTMTGKNNFIAKAMNLFVGMEKMVGPMFEAGLQNLKVMMEAKK